MCTLFSIFTRMFAEKKEIMGRNISHKKKNIDERSGV